MLLVKFCLKSFSIRVVLYLGRFLFGSFSTPGRAQKIKKIVLLATIRVRVAGGCSTERQVGIYEVRGGKSELYQEEGVISDSQGPV